MVDAAANQAVSAEPPLPVFVLAGFLGSGKTTLLNRLLAHPGMRDSAVVVNEFGEIGIDHLLVETSLEDIVLLQSGCLCCSIRGDLVDTLADLAARRDRGLVPGFARVIIETTGLADPAPVLQTLMSHPVVVARYRLGDVVTTVDAVHGLRRLGEFEESVKQAAVADRIVLTKVDIAAAHETEALVTRLRRINPGASVLRVVNGDVAPARLFRGTTLRERGAEVERWLDAEADHHAGHEISRHGDEIRAFCLIHDEPLPWTAVKTWLEAVVSLRGADVLRIKGIVNVAGRAAPVVIHGVQHVFHPPALLARWPSADRRTRIVFITRGLVPGDLGGALDAAAAHALGSLR
jgi:G3E family GTPase